MNVQRKSSKKIRTGDDVIVITGACKGQTGKVLRCIGEKAVVQGINLCKKHVKPSQQQPKGGIIEFEKPIHISNLSPCDKDKSPISVKTRFSESGEKELVYKKDDQLLVWRSMKRKEG